MTQEANTKHRGRKAVQLSGSYLIDTLTKLDPKKPTPLEKIGISPWQMEKFEDNNLVSPVSFKSTPGRGRPKKLFIMSPFGKKALREELQKQLKKTADDHKKIEQKRKQEISELRQREKHLKRIQKSLEAA